MELKIKIRQVEKQDLDACYNVENKCYTNEGASKERIRKRIETYPKGFLIVELKGKIIGIINGTSTDKEDISDEALKDMVDFENDGKNIVIFSVAILPEFQGQGISKPLLKKFINTSKEMKKKKILLICKENLVRYYKKFGFIYIGKSKSNHGGFEWHEMYLPLNNK